MDLGGLFGGVGSALLETAKIAAPLVVNGLIIKHGGKIKGGKVGKAVGKVFGAIPNGLIPIINLGVGSVIGTVAANGDASIGAAYGVQAMTGATTLHQISKIGLRNVFDRLAPSKPWAQKVAKAVGPGASLSI